MNREAQFDWLPLIGSWEESVLSWNEQVETAVRRRRETAETPQSALESERMPSGSARLQ